MTPQTTPTDRPLTAGDVELEDVLFFQLKDLIAEQAEGEWDDGMIVRDAHHFANHLRPLFFASPPCPARENAGFAMNWPMTTHPTLRSANIARQVEWDQDGQITASYRGNELAGEVGEACNVIKKLERERLGIRGSRATIDELADELADVAICADLIARHYGIDLDAAIARKFNATSEKVGLATRMATAGGATLPTGPA